MTSYGEVSAELAGLLEKLQEAGHLRYTLFSFV